MSKIKGVWIDAAIWNLEGFSIMEKLFLQKIKELDNENGCVASNAFFSEFYSVSKSRCTQIIKSLETKGAIKITIIKKGKNITKRVLNILNTLLRKLNTSIKNIKHPYLENCEYNNKEDNNKEEEKKALLLKISNLEKENKKLKKELEEIKGLEIEPIDTRTNQHVTFGILDATHTLRNIYPTKELLLQKIKEITKEDKTEEWANSVFESFTQEGITNWYKNIRSVHKLKSSFDKWIENQHNFDLKDQETQSKKEKEQKVSLSDHFNKYFKKYSQSQIDGKIKEYEPIYAGLEFKYENIAKDYTNPTITAPFIFEVAKTNLGRHMAGHTEEKRIHGLKKWIKELNDYTRNKADIRTEFYNWTYKKDR